MTVTINISPGVLRSLSERATAKGTNIEGYVQNLIEQDVLPQRRISEILAPFRQEVQRSGASDAQLDSLVEEALSDVRQSKRAE